VRRHDRLRCVNRRRSSSGDSSVSTSHIYYIMYPRQRKRTRHVNRTGRAVTKVKIPRVPVLGKMAHRLRCDVAAAGAPTGTRVSGWCNKPRGKRGLVSLRGLPPSDGDTAPPSTRSFVRPSLMSAWRPLSCRAASMPGAPSKAAVQPYASLVNT
jgi:hypothetical protein